MAEVILTFKIMPDSPEVDLEGLKDKIDHMIKEFGGEVGKVEKEPVAFGLVALKMVFVMDESLGDTEDLEKNISELEGVASCEVVDCRRALG